LVSVGKCIAERRLAFRDLMKALDRPESFFQKNFENFFQAKFQKKEDAMLLVTAFAKVSQIANYRQISFAS